MIISERKIKDNCFFIRKVKKYLCLTKQEISKYEYLIPVFAYGIENNLSNFFIKLDKKLVLISIEGISVNVKEIPLKENITDSEELKVYVQVLTGKYYTYISKDLDQIKSEVSIEKNKNYLTLVSIIVIVMIALGGYYKYKKDKEEKLLKLLKKQQERLRRAQSLSFEKQLQIKEFISQKFIEKVANLINNLPNLQKIQYITLSYKPILGEGNAIKGINGEISYKVKSVYPVEGAVKDGKFFSFTKKDVIKGVPQRKKDFKSLKECGIYLLQSGGDLISLKPLKIFYKKDNYYEIKETLNFMKDCKFYFENINLKDQNYSFTVILREK